MDKLVKAENTHDTAFAIITLSLPIAEVTINIYKTHIHYNTGMSADKELELYMLTLNCL